LISVQLNSRVCFAHNHIRIATAWEVIPIDKIFRKPTLDEYKKLGIESGVMVCGKENIALRKGFKIMVEFWGTRLMLMVLWNKDTGLT
jgi:hypothetical protein